jgi:hypothetical protein
VVVEQKR